VPALDPPCDDESVEPIGPLPPEQAITPAQAIRIYTMYGAYSGFEEKMKGSIEKGKLADVIVVSDDPLTVPPDKLKDIKVEMTIVDGKVVQVTH